MKIKGYLTLSFRLLILVLMVVFEISNIGGPYKESSFKQVFPRELMPQKPSNFSNRNCDRNLYYMGRMMNAVSATPQIYTKSASSIIKPNPILTKKSEKILVIPVEFQDVKFSFHDKAYFQNMIFGDVNSLKSFYEKNSYYQLDTSRSGITLEGEIAEPVLSSKTMAFYGADFSPGSGEDDANGPEYELAREAVLELDKMGFDFSQYDTNGDGNIDHLMIIHAGHGQDENYYDSAIINSNLIWTHYWAIDENENNGEGEYVDEVYARCYSMIPETCLLGQLAHEFGHDMGLPDLYDTNGEGYYDEFGSFHYDGKSAGVGYWDVMSYGSWLNEGNNPSGLSAWSKAFLGWASPINIVEDGNYSLRSVEEFPDIYRVWTEGSMLSDEYYLVEYREKTSYDSYLPKGGMLVWHIDEEMTTQNNLLYNDINACASHLGVALEQADGRWDLEYFKNYGDDSDPFPGAKNNANFIAEPYEFNYNNDYTTFNYVEIMNISSISSSIMNADFSISRTAPLTAPTGLLPQQDTRHLSLYPELSWFPASKAEYYKLQVSESADFSTLIYNTVETDTIYYQDNRFVYYIYTPLEENKTYYWRVAGVNNLSNMDDLIWSNTASFTIFIAGDCNYDGRVDINDFVLFSLAYGSSNNDDGNRWDARADFNCDGEINKYDFDILKQNYNK